MSPLHAYQPPSWGETYERASWGRRILIVALAVLALAVAGFIGSVVGPHFKSGSAPPSTSSTTHPPSTTTTTVVHSSVKVLVANGTQEANAASHFAQTLQQQGWNVATPQNSTSPAFTTLVYFAPGQHDAATLVASELGVPATAIQPLTTATPVTNTAGIDVVALIGPNLAGTGFPATTAPAP